MDFDWVKGLSKKRDEMDVANRVLQQKNNDQGGIRTRDLYCT